ncbi:MAG: hypothetical protein ABMB14_07605 [Myxococcota bacterium]
MWVWLATAVSAAPVGHWHPDDLAPISTRFASSSEKLQQPFEARSTAADQVAAALREYRESLDLLGDAAPAAERERLDQLEQEFQRQHAVLQAFADQLVGDYDAAFMAAVDRAVKARGEVEQCPSTVRAGPSIPGIPPKVAPNPDCHGADLNASLASTVDTDPELGAALDEILGRPWPTVAVDRTPQAPIGGGARWLGVHDLVVAGARAELQDIEITDDQDRGEIDAAIESGATIDQLKLLEPKAKAIEARTAGARAALAAPVLAAANKTIAKKWASEPATGWCANPRLLGGCTGDDAARDLVARLLDDKRVAKAFPQ